MDNENKLKAIQLPRTNENENLETISEQILMTFFDVTKFELCTRDKRDKGIDITFDTKGNGSHLGFRFIIQLKATNTIKPNTDGSLSKSIDTSNINFLLHNNHPAYYILHDQSTNIFYYEKLYDFIKILQNKTGNWEESDSHTLRFSKKLTLESTDFIYNEVIEWGMNQRNLQLQTIYISNGLNSNDRISIDSNFNSVSDSEIRKYIEQFGFQLLNDGQWNKILEINTKATGNVTTTSLYNLIIGIANFYSGNKWEAISSLKRAKHGNDLNEEHQFQLLYFDSTVRFSCGLIDLNEYKLSLEKLEQSNSIGLYIKLHRAKQNYLETISETEVGEFEIFKQQLYEIINDPKAHKSVILTAKCELILYQGYENNYNYLRGISRLYTIEEIIGINVQDRIDSAKQFIDANQQWYNFVIEVMEDAKNSNEVFNYYVAVLNEVIVSFQYWVYTTLYKVLKPIPGMEINEPIDNGKSIEIKLTNIDETLNFFRQIGHIENSIVAMATKYEILKFSKRENEADVVMLELENLVDQNDFSEYKERTKRLKNGGCVHEVFQKQLDEISSKVEATKLEHETLIQEMKEMDELESCFDKSSISETYHIHLFPIGYFTFPKSQKNKVFEILNISDSKVKENFEWMFETVVPIANIHNESVAEEGFAGGHLADRGIESWRNIHRVRKSFFENGFYRNDMNKTVSFSTPK